MNILTINCGSSSVKIDLLDTQSGERHLQLKVERVETPTPVLKIAGRDEAIDCDRGGGHENAIACALPYIQEVAANHPIQGVGHRVVHGGEKFSAPVTVTDEVEATIEQLIPLAPLHNPANLAGIRAMKKLFPDLPHVAVFDTAFHTTLPARAKYYALPKDLSQKLGIRRYGFHGTSHQYVAKKAAEYMQADVRELRIITCHLGSGCSVAAVEYGRSVETSTGMTPLEGLVMGTRVGDIDPGVLIHIMREERMSVDDLDILLNHDSGLKGLSGGSNDMRDIIDRASGGDDDARLAIHLFAHRIRKYIGAYAAVMGGVDAIVFTGGIGENSAVIRHRATQRLDYLGAIINEDKNRDAKLSNAHPVADFGMNHSRVKLLAVATDEELSIARQTSKIVLERNKVNEVPPIPIAISARHVHLTQETVETLFGKGYQLTERNPLSQPVQFAANETVAVVGPKNTIEHVRILGPVRSANQVEISRTDEFFLGIDAPVRESGKTENTPGCKLIGPAGEVELDDGVICAWRHIHMTPKDAETFGVGDRDVVEVEVQTGNRSLVFGDVLIRVSDKYKLEMHIDTDEGNAADLNQGARGALISTTGSAHLKRRRVQHDVVEA